MASSGRRPIETCSSKTRTDLEWDRVLDAIAEHCEGELGARYARSHRFLSSEEQVRRMLGQVRETLTLLEDDEPLAGGGAPIVGPSLDRLRAGGVLAPQELVAIERLLVRARELRRFLRRHRDQAEGLLAACDTDPRLDTLADELGRCFDPGGVLSDAASPVLRELRAQRQASRERLVHKIEDVMQRYAATLQDDYFTEREGRFVIPVRADSHERFAGIVHATSGSGQTLFMEPRSVIPLGNKLKMIDAQVQREELAVYASLSEQLAAQIESITAAEQALAFAEFLLGVSRLAVDLDLQFPTISAQPTMDLIEACHPLLQLDGVDVVPADIRVQAGHALVVSGPNAGGKTVALKTLGLVALMTRAGLPVPCDPKSTVGVFGRVASDMGDEQSISKNLSTFSAHVRNLSEILDETTSGTLVLLDEIATGTDPRQGEALAVGVLDSLCARGGAVVCTTHYEGLKTLALGDERFDNASVGFDMTTMTPTFRLMLGIPGASSALAIAERFGLPSLVVERARTYLGTEEQGLDEVVRKLNDERRALEVARGALERELRGVQRQRDEVQLELQRARERERNVVSKQTRDLLSAVKRAREDLRVAQQKLRGKKLRPEKVKQAASLIEKVGRQVAVGGVLEHAPPNSGGSNKSPVDAANIRPGLNVYVPRIRQSGQVIEVLGADRVRVSFGVVKMSLKVAELRAASVQDARPSAPVTNNKRGERKSQRGTFVLDAASDPTDPIQTSENTCDLRGLRADEAEAMSEQFLDRSLNEGRRVAFLIHGYGTGSLRQSVRALLQGSSYVRKFRPGRHGEGGDGVTVVWLR